MATYLDTSALVKLVVNEAESTPLRMWLGAGDRFLVSSDLARTELMRALQRNAPDLAPQARRLLDSIGLLELSSGTFDAAGRLPPVGLRSLDAVHLAAALELGDDLDALVTYDDRLAEAAASHGVEVVWPG